MSFIRDREPAKISHGFAEHEPAVVPQTIAQIDTIELIHNTPCACVEFGAITRRPPILERSGGIEFGAAVVELMSHFMSDHSADGAVIRRIVRVHIKEWRLQNSRWKCDFH